MCVLFFCFFFKQVCALKVRSHCVCAAYIFLKLPASLLCCLTDRGAAVGCVCMCGHAHTCACEHVCVCVQVDTQNPCHAVCLADECLRIHDTACVTSCALAETGHVTMPEGC